MRSSFRLFRLAGISIEVHISFVLFFLLLSFAGLANMVFFLFIFSLVLAHELCHSIAALLSGIKVPRIILLPFGGLSSIEIPENPINELKISLAGPFFNFFLAGVSLLLMKAFGLGLTGYYDLLNMLDSGGVGVFTASFMMSILVMSNLVLGLFNMIPAFPMDGGRVLRSVLALWLDYGKATEIAGGVGNVVFLFFIVGGIFSQPLNIWLIIMGLFLAYAGGGEVRFVLFRRTLAGLSMRDLVSSQHRLPVVDGSLPVEDFLRLVARPDERFYLVVKPDGSLGGVLDVRMLDNPVLSRKSLTAGSLAQEGYGVVDASAGVTDGIRTVLEKDLTLVVDGSTVVGYVTPELFMELAHFYRLKKKSGFAVERR